jgi:hypothetical protein
VSAFSNLSFKQRHLKNHRLTITFKDGKVDCLLSWKTPHKQVGSKAANRPCQFGTEDAR